MHSIFFAHLILYFITVITITDHDPPRCVAVSGPTPLTPLAPLSQVMHTLYLLDFVNLSC
jgi:hypothetical protein